MLESAHRSWLPPQRNWLMAQTWHDLLFAHWPVRREQLRAIVPSVLTIDEYEGQPWIGVVPFRMTDIRFRGTPPVLGFSKTIELNLRTYVRFGGIPGIFFFSLDAGSPLAVRIARRFFHLPYFDAEMSFRTEGDAVEYRSRRLHHGASPAEFNCCYRPSGDVRFSTPGTLDHWLTERYCFYTAGRGGVFYRGNIHHQPWPLQPATAEFRVNGLTLPWGIDLPDITPLLHFARRLEILAWSPERIDAHRSF